MIVTIIIGIIVGIPLLLAVVWVLNMLWLSLVNLYRSLTGSSKPHGCPPGYPETIERIFRN